MGDRTKVQLEADRRTRTVRRMIGGELRIAREDQGRSQRAVATAAGIDRSHVSRVETGSAAASVDTMSRIASALGGEISVRYYPGTGPRVRDHLQAAIIAALANLVHPGWRRFLEVPVYRPVRGVIDVVLHDPHAALVVATEVQSELRRLEQLLRWSNEKRDALPSSDLWAFASRDEPIRTSALLVVRSTQRTRAIANEYEAVLRAAYPARARDAYDALRTQAAWPGPAILWATVDAGKARILDGPPRSVRLGR